MYSKRHINWVKISSDRCARGRRLLFILICITWSSYYLYVYHQQIVKSLITWKSRLIVMAKPMPSHFCFTHSVVTNSEASKRVEKWDGSRGAGQGVW